MLSVGAAVVASPCVAISSVVAWPLRATPAVERTVIGVGIIELAETVRAPRMALRRSPHEATPPALDDDDIVRTVQPAHCHADTRYTRSFFTQQVLSCDIDLLHPTAEYEKRSHKLKRLVESPNSYFMDVKCQGCFSITTVFSHSQTVVVCPSCNAVLCVPTGGKARLSEGCSFRRKTD